MVAHANTKCQHFGRPANHWRPGIQDQPGQHGVTEKLTYQRDVSQNYKLFEMARFGIMLNKIIQQKKIIRGQVQWLMPTISALWEAEHFGRPRRADHLRSGVQDYPGQHGETLSLLKLQKLAGPKKKLKSQQALKGETQSVTHEKIRNYSRNCCYWVRKPKCNGDHWIPGWKGPTSSTLITKDKTSCFARRMFFLVRREQGPPSPNLLPSQQQQGSLQPRSKLSQLFPQTPEKTQEPPINLSKVVIKFNKDQLEELKEAFKLFGRVEDGKILYSQFRDMMGALGQNPTNAKVLKVLGNPKRDELKSQHQQPAAKNRNQGTYEDYLEGLHVFDEEENSKVNRAELRQVLTTLGEKTAEEEMETVLAGHEDSKACINYKAFLKQPKPTREAESGESLEPGRRRLQSAEIMPLHSSLGDRARAYFRLKGREKGKGTSKVSKEISRAPPDFCPYSPDQAAGKSEGPANSKAKFSALPCSAAARPQPPAEESGFSPSHQLWPKSSPNRPLSALASRDPGPRPYLRLPPRPRRLPSTPATVSPARPPEVSPRARRCAPQAAGGCCRKRSCLPGCCGFSLPPKTPPSVCLSPNPQSLPGAGSSQPARRSDQMLRQKESGPDRVVLIFWPRLSHFSLPGRSQTDCARERHACGVSDFGDWARWLTPVIPAFWEAEAEDHLRSGVQDQSGQHARWLTLVIPALWEAKEGYHLSPGVGDQPGQHGETPSLLKEKEKKGKKISRVWLCAPVMPATLEAEVGGSLDRGKSRLQ
ncbi:Myosin light chain 6B [Plecturocebus cupreus]